MSDSKITELVLPAELQPPSEPETVRVPIDFIVTRDLTSQQIQELETKLGAVHLTASYLKPLNHLGCGAEHLGVIRTTRGGVLVTPQALLKAITACKTIINGSEIEYTTRERLEGGRLLGYLSGKWLSVHSRICKLHESARSASTRDAQDLKL